MRLVVACEVLLAATAVLMAVSVVSGFQPSRHADLFRVSQSSKSSLVRPNVSVRHAPSGSVDALQMAKLGLFDADADDAAAKALIAPLAPLAAIGAGRAYLTRRKELKEERRRIIEEEERELARRLAEIENRKNKNGVSALVVLSCNCCIYACQINILPVANLSRGSLHVCALR